MNEHWTLAAMRGSKSRFIRLLADLYQEASEEDKAKIRAAWPNAWNHYTGAGHDLHKQTKRTNRLKQRLGVR